MRLLENKNCFLIEDFFDENIIAGFTKPNLSGNVQEDIPQVLSDITKKFKVAYLNQIHSSLIHNIVDEGCYEGDGLITKKSGLVCVVRTADCMPVFLSSKDIGAIGVIHMGWRGAKKGILDNISYDLSSFKAIVGAGMRKCCYQIGREFLDYQEFNGFIKEENDILHFDSVDFILQNFLKRGLDKSNFVDLNICNMCSPENFFSYRKNATKQRMLSFIFRKG